MARGRPRKYPNGEMIAKDPLSPQMAEDAVEGNALKQMAREKTIDELERTTIITNLSRFARETISVKNYPILEFRSMFIEVADCYVSYYFPITRDEDGKIIPTYVDAPQNARQMMICQKKAEWFKAKGFRYFILKPDERMTPENIRSMVSPGSQGETMMNESHIEAL